MESPSAASAHVPREYFTGRLWSTYMFKKQLDYLFIDFLRKRKHVFRLKRSSWLHRRRFRQ